MNKIPVCNMMISMGCRYLTHSLANRIRSGKPLGLEPLEGNAQQEDPITDQIALPEATGLLQQTVDPLQTPFAHPEGARGRRPE